MSFSSDIEAAVNSGKLKIKDTATQHNAIPARRNRPARGRTSRHVAGQMNKTEQRYASEILEPMKQAGEIIAYWFESYKFRLADATFYTPDFVIQRPDGELEVVEVKGGYWEDDARVKIKVFAAHYPFSVTAVKLKTAKEGKGWAIEQFN